MNPTVSIIVPIYNVQRFLDKCIESLVNQTYKNIHIILVNDKSPDDSYSICLKYSRKYPAIIDIINKSNNEGVDKARFSGLNLVFKQNPNGYVTFVDADDWLDRDAISCLVENAVKHDADVVSMQCYRYFFKGFKTYGDSYAPYKLYSRRELSDKWFVSFFGHVGLSTYMWGKCYKVSVIQIAALKPSKYRMCEDHIFNMYLFPYISSWLNIEYRGYYYRYGGMTSRFNPLWPELRNQNIDKRKFAARIGKFDQVKTLLDIELKNIFYTDVAQRLKFCNDTEFNCWLNESLSDPIWHETLQSADSQGNSDFYYIYNKDLPSIVLRAKELNKQSFIKKSIKRIAGFINKYCV